MTVTGLAQAWRDYERWNGAIAEELFPVREAVEPVYLDLEDEQLAALGERFGLDASGVCDELGRVVAATLDLGSQAHMFSGHSRRLRQWNRTNRESEPPVLALLAVLSLAAERMAAGDGLGAGNFYGRLRELLGIDHGDRRIDSAYREVAERYWAALGRWLSAHEGRRGLPTAYAIGHRYIGLPVSQALVRRADRDRLVDFFLRFSLAPGTEVPPSELEALLDAWMRQSPCPATKHLERLWSKADARRRIGQAASVALATWDGRVSEREGSESAGRPSGRVVLGLELGGFPKKRFKLSVLAYLPQPGTARDGFLVTAGRDVRVPLAPTLPGALGFGQAAHIDASNLLEGVMTLRDGLSGAEAIRHPRRVIVFRQDQLSMRWLETQQIMLGDDLILVARDDLRDRVTEVLGAVARPGWELVVSDGYAGMPPGWFVVRGVEVLSHPGGLVPDRLDDLSVLVPLTSSQLKVGGGFALPGAARGKWHSWAPPEIRAVSDVPGGFELRLYDLTDAAGDDLDEAPQEILLGTWSDDGSGLLVVDLADEELEDGDYRVDLVPRGASDALTTTQLRLRSGDTPDLLQWTNASTLVQDLADPLAVVSAGTGSGGPLVRGAVVERAAAQALAAGEIGAQPWWQTDRSLARRPRTAGVRVALPDAAECLRTGRHREVVDTVPTDSLGRPLVRWSRGRCGGCGLERRYSTSYYRNKKRKERAQAVSAVDVTRDVSFAPRVSLDDDREWDVVLDGIFHTGGGRWSLLERLAMHIEPTALFVDQLARALESLGHIEIRRDASTLEPVEWEVTPLALVGTRNGCLMVGHWSNDVTEQVRSVLPDEDSVTSIVNEDGPSSWFLEGDGEELRADETIQELEVVVDDQAWRSLVECLPALSEVVSALPRRAVGGSGRIRWFDVKQAAWVDAEDLEAPGGYRITRFGTTDVIRAPEDVEAGSMAASTVQLSKHAAALLLAGNPLLAHNPATEELHVPLGADLPGLYGRAAVLASGRLPTANGRLLTYHQVPGELARHLAHLLTH
jgi:hypothetical protein